jgi:hypothetical protein
MSVFVCFFAFFGAKIRPAAAGTGELGWDLRDQTLFSFTVTYKRWRNPGPSFLRSLQLELATGSELS